MWTMQQKYRAKSSRGPWSDWPGLWLRRTVIEKLHIWKKLSKSVLPIHDTKCFPYYLSIYSCVHFDKVHLGEITLLPSILFFCCMSKLTYIQSWKFIKERKKVRKQENTLSTKKATKKKKRKHALDKESNKKTKKNR